jgi:O6-methylguanine-DNA--protein-cysteine methyltransferase
VVGGDGKLTGYSGGDGLATKRYFLQMESAAAA